MINVYCLLFNGYCLLFIVYCLLVIVYCFLLYCKGTKNFEPLQINRPKTTFSDPYFPP